MKTRFLDGPASGLELSLRRAPTFLRVVCDHNGDLDALDQLDDVAEEGERLYAYRVVEGTRNRFHLLVRGKEARTRGGWWELADYRWCDDQPSDEVLRDNTKWRQWTLNEAAKAKEFEV